MTSYILSIVLLIIALVAIELRKGYHHIPKNELRRRALAGDILADKVYQAVAYEDRLETFLWLVIILTTASSLFVFNQVAPLWLDFLAIILFLGVAFAWLPKVRINSLSDKLIIYLTSAIIKILAFLETPLQKISRVLFKQDAIDHTGIYDKDDLMALIKNQQKQTDSRIKASDLAMLKKALKLADKTLSQYSRPWSKIVRVNSSDSIGPVLLDELHKTDQLFVPVIDDEETNKVVGMVDLSRIDLSTANQVRDLMDRNLYYLNEDEKLEEALSAMAATGHPVFVVLDKKKEADGLITLKDVLSEIFEIKQSTKDYSLIDQPSEKVAEEETVLREDETDSLSSTQSVE